MPFKINIAEKTGKTYKLETESKALFEKQLHDKVEGKDISPELEGYEFEITGASDTAGFTAMENVEGIGLKKVLLSYEKGMKKRPKKEGKKKRSDSTPKGLRLRKTVRGKIISKAISQINLKILKEGSKKLAEIFPEQNKPKEEEKKKEETQEEKKEEPKTEEKPKEEKPAEEKHVEEKKNKNERQ